MLGFLNGLFYRTNCYSCRYAKPERVGDLTLGDFWGLGEQVPFEQPTSKGVSLILVNTGKGRDLFERCKSKLEFFERTLDEAINGNEQLRHPAPKHRNYDLFRSSIEKTSFGAATRVCLRREIVKQRIGRFVLRNRTLRLVYRRLRTVVKR